MKTKSRGAWPDWIESEEGKRCANPKTLNLDYRQGEFLENRLWAAFVAGMKAERDAQIKQAAKGQGIVEKGAGEQ